MVSRQAIRLLVLLAMILAFAVFVPPHIALEHHGEAAESHGGEDHHQGDHTVLSSTVDLRPSALLCDAVDLVPEAQGLVIVVRTDRLHDPPDPDLAASPPSPPRAPPSLRA